MIIFTKMKLCTVLANLAVRLTGAALRQDVLSSALEKRVGAGFRLLKFCLLFFPDFYITGFYGFAARVLKIG